MHEPEISPTSDLAARDRHLRLRTNTATPAERLAAMRELIERSWAVLQRNPEGVAHFRSRNYSARAVSILDGQTRHGT
jgi:hypothetical protein